MSRSRLSTRIVSHQASCFPKARTINDDESRSLSAMGSRYAPSEECWLNLLAIRPSMPSENPAITKISKAHLNFSYETKIKKNGRMQSRRNVIWLGTVQMRPFIVVKNSVVHELFSGKSAGLETGCSHNSLRISRRSFWRAAALLPLFLFLRSQPLARFNEFNPDPFQANCARYS